MEFTAAAGICLVAATFMPPSDLKAHPEFMDQKDLLRDMDVWSL